MKFTSRAPARIDPAGGGTDAPPYCIEHGGAVVNFSIARYASASCERLPRNSGVVVFSHDLDAGVQAASVDALKLDGRMRFLTAILKRLAPGETDLMVIGWSEIPMRTGLGGSGAMGVAMVGAITRSLGRSLSKPEIALLANDIERSDLGNIGGNQDSFGAAIGGIKLITYHQGGGCQCERLHVPTEFIAQLERDTLLVHTGDVHLSGSIHSDIKRWYVQKDSPTVRAMDNLKDAAQRMARALESGDLEGYLRCLNVARVNHYALHPSCDSDVLRRFFAALEPGVFGGKTCGAGGGGFLFVHMKPGCRTQCVEAARALGGTVMDFRLDTEGLVTSEEEGSSRTEIDRILSRIGPR